MPYASAADAPAFMAEGRSLLPAGLELTAAPGAKFPADVAAVLPADAARAGATEALVVAGTTEDFPAGEGAGAALVRTRDGDTVAVAFASAAPAPAGGARHVVVRAAPGESFPAGAVSLAVQGGAEGALPHWLSASFEPTSLEAQTTEGPMAVHPPPPYCCPYPCPYCTLTVADVRQVYKSKQPVAGSVVLGGNAAAPAAAGGAAWGNYIPVLVPLGQEARLAGAAGGAKSQEAFPLDNYVALAKPLGAGHDFSPAAPGSLAVGAESAFNGGGGGGGGGVAPRPRMRRLRKGHLGSSGESLWAQRRGSCAARTRTLRAAWTRPARATRARSP